MPADKQAEGSGLEKYKMTLSLWNKERASGRQEFLGFIIATVILVLVSLSGTWWPPLFGILVSLVWLILSIRSSSHQEYLYQELEKLGSADSANPILQVHRFEQGEVKVPFFGDITKLFQPASRYVFLCAPAVFIVIWVFGFLLSFFT
ncbi:MAG: hypothetical protein JRI86_14530 [Deltaproteobacteria bacterium]|nr:hypothetical protein [Deltaproteobacteria bacterium]